MAGKRVEAGPGCGQVLGVEWRRGRVDSQWHDRAARGRVGVLLAAPSAPGMLCPLLEACGPRRCQHMRTSLAPPEKSRACAGSAARGRWLATSPERPRVCPSPAGTCPERRGGAVGSLSMARQRTAEPATWPASLLMPRTRPCPPRLTSGQYLKKTSTPRAPQKHSGTSPRTGEPSYRGGCVRVAAEARQATLVDGP